MKKVAGTDTQLLIILICFIAGFFSTLQDMFQRWTKFDEAYGHGLLIIGIFIFLLIDSRPRLAGTPARPAPWALALLASLSLLWLAAYAASISLLQELLLPAILLAGWLALCGRRRAKLLLFPVLFLYFAIPVWDYLNDALVHLTVLVVQAPLPLLHITTLVEGNAIHIAAGTVFIADGCSGLRYLITGTALATLAAWLNFRQLRSRIAVVIAGIALSLIANWVRVFSLILIAHYTQMQSPLIKQHDHFGWVVFLIVISPIFVASWMASPHRKPSQASPGPETFAGNTSVRHLLPVLLAMLCGPLLGLTLTTSKPRDFAVQIVTPMHWIEATRRDTDWQPTLPRAYQLQQKTLLHSSDMMGVSVHAYRKESPHTKLLPYIASLYDKERWTLLDSQSLAENTPQGAMMIGQLNLKSTRNDDRYAVWYWFDIGGKVTASYAYAKLLQIPALLRRENHALVTVLWSRCKDSRCSDAHAVLRQYMADADTRALKPVVP